MSSCSIVYYQQENLKNQDMRYRLKSLPSKM